MLAEPTTHADLFTQITTAAVGLMFATTTALNHFKGKRRDKGNGSTLHEILAKLDEHRDETRERFSEMTLELHDLKGMMVGIDGQNGFRGDLREVKKTVGGLMDRERDRLERGSAP